MGLPIMDDIHAPTVASGPTNGRTSSGIALEKLSLTELIKQKDNIEAELKALGSVLDSVRFSMATPSVQISKD